MKHQSWIKWLLGVAAIAAIAMTAGLSQKASAVSLSDGTYTLPVKLLKIDSTATSIANHYFTQTGQATVTGNQATVTVTTNGANFIKKMTANGAAVTESNLNGHSADLSFTTTNQPELVPVTFAIQAGILKLNEKARFKLDWNGAKLVSAPTTTGNASATQTGTTTGTTTTQPTPVVTPTTTAAPTTTVAKQSTNKVTTKKVTKKATKKATKIAWRYRVIQGSSNKTSEANRFYTHTPSVKKSGKYYRVALKIAYKKSLKMGSKGVIPLTMNGKKIKKSAIKYGATKHYYTVVYYYHIKSLNTLKKLNKGTIHVKVPTVGISQAFKIRFKFSKTAHKAASATSLAHPTIAATTGSQAAGRVA